MKQAINLKSLRVIIFRLGFERASLKCSVEPASWLPKGDVSPSKNWIPKLTGPLVHQALENRLFVVWNAVMCAQSLGAKRKFITSAVLAQDSWMLALKLSVTKWVSQFKSNLCPDSGRRSRILRENYRKIVRSQKFWMTPEASKEIL